MLLHGRSGALDMFFRLRALQKISFVAVVFRHIQLTKPDVKCYIRVKPCIPVKTMHAAHRSGLVKLRIEYRRINALCLGEDERLGNRMSLMPYCEIKAILFSLYISN